MCNPTQPSYRRENLVMLLVMSSVLGTRITFRPQHLAGDCGTCCPRACKCKVFEIPDPNSDSTHSTPPNQCSVKEVKKDKKRDADAILGGFSVRLGSLQSHPLRSWTLRNRRKRKKTCSSALGRCRPNCLQHFTSLLAKIDPGYPMEGLGLLE
jgi:hypothetical protein